MCSKAAQAVNIFQFAAKLGQRHDPAARLGRRTADHPDRIALGAGLSTLAMERSDGGTGMDLIMWVKGVGTDAITVKDYFNPAFEAAGAHAAHRIRRLLKPGMRTGSRWP
ncbi:hypothetical protein LP419_11485 [Massilia sp. H-1]|nr:hypothetical protein LP419_11485 [Massilia sp. H-1]